MCGRFTSKAKPKEIEEEFKAGKINPALFEQEKQEKAKNIQLIGMNC